MTLLLNLRSAIVARRAKQQWKAFSEYFKKIRKKFGKGQVKSMSGQRPKSSFFSPLVTKTGLKMAANPNFAKMLLNR